MLGMRNLLLFAVALSLLDGNTVSPIAGADATEIQSLVDVVNSASGLVELLLFGQIRLIDASQFQPRGHYTDSPELERYFRSLMWLGRVDLRLIETEPDGQQVFHRRQFEAALAGSSSSRRRPASSLSGISAKG